MNRVEGSLAMGAAVAKRITGIVACAIMCVALLAGCSYNTYGGSSDVGTTTPTGEKSTWAIYWSCCGSDLESQSGAATDDFAEMLATDVGPDVKVVIQTGGTSSWRNNVMDPDKIQRYEYANSNLNLIDQQPQADMGDPSTLESFLTYCKTNYPADHTMVVFWDHGGGSVSGVCFDENYDYDSLTLAELDQAFSNVGSKYDVVGMDTCLMATLDNANVMSKYANYLVASEEEEPGNGWNYTDLLADLAANPSMSPSELSRDICDTFQTGCEQYGTSKTMTMSVTDLSKVNELVSAVDSMGKEALTSAAKDSRVVGQFGRSARASVNFGGNNEQDGYADMVDLGDLMKNASSLVPTTDDSVIDALNDAVVYQVRGSYRREASGLSTYYSFDGDEQALAEYLEVAASPTYANFIRYSLGEDITGDITNSTGVESTPVQGFTGTPTITIGSDGQLRMELDPSSLDSVASVTFDLIYTDWENGQFIYLGNDNDISGDWETGVFEDNFRGMWGSMDGHFAFMELAGEGDDYNLYSVPVKLNGKETNMEVVYDFNEGAYSIIGVSDGIDETTGMSDRTSAKLKKGDQISLITYGTDSSGSNVVQYESDPISYTGPDQFTEIELYNGTYAYEFVVKDTMGTESDTDFAYITYTDGETTYSLD